MWKIKLFVKCVGYDVASWILKMRIKMAWARMGAVQEELDRVKAEARAGGTT